MDPVRHAVIDVGTNSVKLLVAEVTGPEVRPLHEESHQTRLGRGLYQTHRLQPDSIAQTADAVAEFADKARSFDAGLIRVIATSAARDALNAADLTAAIEEASGLKTEIISGSCEAEMTFRGVTTDPALAAHPLMLLDLGGGSAEFILGHGRQKTFAHSFPLGTVRLLEQFPHGDPPSPVEFASCRDWLNTFLGNEVRPLLTTALSNKPHDIRLAGTGGTATLLACIENKLAKFDRNRIEQTVLTLEQIAARRANLWNSTLSARHKITGLPRQRADVIMTGVLIFEAVMREFGFGELRITTRGLRFAAVME